MRETTKITTPSGVIIEIYSYLTGREARELQKIFLKHAKFEGSPDEHGKTGEKRTKVVDFDASAISEAEETALRFLVHSVNGETLNATDKVEELKADDYRAVVKAINGVTKDVFEPTDFLAP